MSREFRRPKERTKAPPSKRYENLKANSELLKEAKQKAHSIVLKLLEVGTSNEFLTENIPFITGENYEDVVVERAIIGVCGYPLCDAPINNKNLKDQTYVIRNNKVYDITQRRNFCSKKCYEASEIISRQIPTTPLYLRSTDEDVQKFKLKIPELASLKGKTGKRVNITGVVLDSEIDLIGSEESSKKNHRLSSSPQGLPKDFSDDTEEDSLREDVDELLSEEVVKLSVEEKKSQKLHNGQPTPKDGVEEKVSAPENEHGRQTSSRLADIYEIERILKEWMTFETLRIILGDVYVKGMLEHMGKIWEDYDKVTTDVDCATVDLKSKFVSLCKKLDKDERKEKLLDARELSEDHHEDSSQVSDPKPVPDYEELKRDVEQSSLKVRAFYDGVEEFVSSKRGLETIQEEEDDINQTCKTRRSKSRASREEEIDSGTLPLIDTYSQKSWRRQIVLDKLSKRLSEYSVDFGLDEGEVRRLTVALIATFDLSSHNISFKMNQWKFVAVILIKMLSVRYPPIAKVFIPSDEKYHLIASLVHEQGLDEGYFNRLLSYLTDISYILTKCDKPFSTLNKDNDPYTPKETTRVPQTTRDPNSRHDNKIQEIATNIEELD